MYVLNVQVIVVLIWIGTDMRKMVLCIWKLLMGVVMRGNVPVCLCLNSLHGGA